MNYAWESDVNYDYLIYGSGEDLNFSWDREKWTYYFLDGERGVIKTQRYRSDTYFGSSNKTFTTGFTYRMQDGYLIITGNATSKYAMQGNALIMQDTSSPTILNRRSLTQDDRDYMALAPYYMLSGEERANFPVKIEGYTNSRGYLNEKNRIYWPAGAYVTLSAKDHIYSRHISEIELTFTLKSGTGYGYDGSKSVKHISVNSDEDMTVSMGIMYVSGNNPVFTITCRAWDNEKGKYYTLRNVEPKELIFTKPDYVKDAEGGNTSGNDDNSDDNIGSDNGNNSGSDNNKLSGTNNGHEWVDLGLSVKWATCNIGAPSPTGNGYYYAWGETKPHSNGDYYWDSYQWCGGTDSYMTKYCTESSKGKVDNKTTLDLSDDAARANWGSTWRMPTMSEFEELCSKCKCTWTTMGGTEGYKFESKTNNNYIFLAADGYRSNWGITQGFAAQGHYWSSSLDKNNSNCANRLFFSDSIEGIYVGKASRAYGLRIRPVCP